MSVDSYDEGIQNKGNFVVLIIMLVNYQIAVLKNLTNRSHFVYANLWTLV